MTLLQEADRLDVTEYGYKHIMKKFCEVKTEVLFEELVEWIFES